MVRVKAVLRRTASGNEKEAPQQLVYKGLILDMTKKKVSIDGIEVSLTKKNLRFCCSYCKIRDVCFPAKIF